MTSLKWKCRRIGHVAGVHFYGRIGLHCNAEKFLIPISVLFILIQGIPAPGNRNSVTSVISQNLFKLTESRNGCFLVCKDYFSLRCSTGIYNDTQNS